MSGDGLLADQDGEPFGARRGTGITQDGEIPRLHRFDVQEAQQRVEHPRLRI